MVNGQGRRRRRCTKGGTRHGAGTARAGWRHATVTHHGDDYWFSHACPPSIACTHVSSIYSISTRSNQAAMKNFKKSLVFLSLVSHPSLILPPQLRGKDSNSSKNKPQQPSSTPSSTSTSSSALSPQSSASAQASLPNSSGHNGSNHSHVPQPPSQSSRPSVQTATPQDRRLAVDRAAPAPPIVVVSPDNSDQTSRKSGGYGSPERLSIGLEPGGSTTPPRTSPLNRLRGPKDTIPIVGKPPRKQRSSRFVVTEKVEIERLPPFLGLLYRFTPDLQSSYHRLRNPTQ